MKIFRLLYPFFFRNVPKERCNSCLYSSLANDPPPRALLDYLITECGFPSEEAAKVCQRVKPRRDSVQKLERVVCFLSESGFSDTQIRKVISTDHRLLGLKVEKTLLPKMKAFQDWGLSAHEVAQTVERNPRILHSSLESTLLPIVGVFKTVLPDDKNLGTAIKSLFSGLRTPPKVKTLETHVSKLRSLGVPESSIGRMFVSCPRMFHHNPSSLERRIEKVRQFGLDYDSTMFPFALATLCGLKESTWNSKVEVLKGFGFSDENVVEAFRKAPLLMTLSTSSLQSKLDYFTNELGVCPSVLAAAPSLLMYSLEKRVIPRLAVVQKLESGEIVQRRKWSIVSILTCSEKRFNEIFVFKHMNECPEVVQMYINSKEKKEKKKSDDVRAGKLIHCV